MTSQPTAALAALSLLLAPSAFAGKPVPKESTPEPKAATAPESKAGKGAKPGPGGKAVVAPDGKSEPEPPKRVWFPDEPAGSFTLGTMFSEDRSGVYLNGIVGIWSPQQRDAFLFLDAGFHYEDNGQVIWSTGLGFRKLWSGKDVIIGANVFWDAIDSEYENDIDQLGLGVEVLTRWVDLRFNYYLPEDDLFEIGSRTSSRTRSSFGGGGITRTTERSTFKRYESGLEGYNAELGVLLYSKGPELRAYAGFYHYENPFGGDFDGFKARLEARFLRGVTANVEYWDDEELMGGHWTGELSVSLPFSFYNLFTGKNPFEGAGDAFKSLPRPFSARMGDPIERSHRIQTVTSGDILTDRSIKRRFTPLATGSGGGTSSNGGGSGFPIE
jgi:hypothetical protein